MEQFLRKYVDFSQEDWEDWLPMAEFSANNLASASTGMSPFFANKGFHPRMSFGPPRPLARDIPKRIREQEEQGNAFATKMEQIMESLRTNLINARAAQEQQANKSRIPAPAYRAGDQVFLDRRNITTDRPMQKLEQRFLGPFAIEKVLNSHAYKLKLTPELSRLHTNFHTNLLRPAPTNPFPGQLQQPALPVSTDVNGEKLWAVEAIVNARRANKRFEYEVLWRGYDSTDNTWEPLAHVINVRSAITEFQRRFPRKPRPTKKEIAVAKYANKWQGQGEGTKFESIR
jgi:hypothetical protein